MGSGGEVPILYELYKLHLSTFSIKRKPWSTLLRAPSSIYIWVVSIVGEHKDRGSILKGNLCTGFQGRHSLPLPPLFPPATTPLSCTRGPRPCTQREMRAASGQLRATFPCSLIYSHCWGLFLTRISSKNSLSLIKILSSFVSASAL